MKKSGFTLIELIFVIVIIGVLSAVAIPKFTNLKDNAEVTNMVKPIAQIQENGSSAYMNLVELEEDTTPTLEEMFEFKGKGWVRASAQRYTYTTTKGDLMHVEFVAATPRFRIYVTDADDTVRTKVGNKTGLTIPNSTWVDITISI